MCLAQIVELGGPHPAMVSALLKVMVLHISLSVACIFYIFIILSFHSTRRYVIGTRSHFIPVDPLNI